ncbi:PP2C family protein-serine/threonine phosphatase [Planctomycetota bacterium]|nr:PP2C family protein-serine/threonine phosphatase [Planctomycetota bacterium]
MRKLKTQGAPIKRKFVLAMSGISLGVSFLIFAVVMVISQASLEDTIVQSGKGNLQQAEALYRPYEAGLNDKALIGYFGQTKNEKKFSKWWTGAQKWYHPNIRGYRGFSSFNEMYEDRLWVLVAGQLIVVNEEGAPKFGASLTKEEKIQLLGPAYYDIERKFFEVGGEKLKLKGGKTPKDLILDEPSFARRVNHKLMEKFSHIFNLFLVKKAGLPQGQEYSFDQISNAIRKKTKEGLVDGPAGLRMQIISHFKSDFIADLDKLTTSETSQVRFIHVKFKNSPAPMVAAEVVNLLSPNPKTDTIPVTSEGKTFVDEGITVDSSASVNDSKAYKFEREVQGEGTVIAVYLDREEIDNRKNTLVLSILGVSVLAIVLALGLAFFIGNSVTKPLEVLMHDIQVISGGNFDHKPQARSKDEIGIVAKLLGDMAAGLKSAQDVWLENQGRKHDLDVAKEIQENLLPKHVPRIAGYDVSAYYSPSKEVGGDYYDFFLVDKTHLGMICADVSGKGIPGSMVMMMAKALVSYEAQDNLSPRDIFCKVNRTLAKDIKRGMFVTAMYMLLDIPTARLTVASAGHNPLLLYRAATKQCVEVNPGGIALGFDKDGRLFERSMKEEVVQLQRGDRAVIYTDGVTEAMSPTNEEYGEERMNAVTMQCADKSSSQYLTELVNSIQGHAQSDEQHDDITIVTLKVG